MVCCCVNLNRQEAFDWWTKESWRVNIFLNFCEKPLDENNFNLQNLKTDKNLA